MSPCAPTARSGSSQSLKVESGTEARSRAWVSPPEGVEVLSIRVIGAPAADHSVGRSGQNPERFRKSAGKDSGRRPYTSAPG